MAGSISLTLGATQEDHFNQTSIAWPGTTALTANPGDLILRNRGLAATATSAAVDGSDNPDVTLTFGSYLDSLLNIVQGTGTGSGAAPQTSYDGPFATIAPSDYDPEDPGFRDIELYGDVGWFKDINSGLYPVRIYSSDQLVYGHQIPPNVVHPSQDTTNNHGRGHFKNTYIGFTYTGSYSSAGAPYTLVIGSINGGAAKWVPNNNSGAVALTQSSIFAVPLGNWLVFNVNSPGNATAFAVIPAQNIMDPSNAYYGWAHIGYISDVVDAHTKLPVFHGWHGLHQVSASLIVPAAVGSQQIVPGTSGVVLATSPTDTFSMRSDTSFVDQWQERPWGGSSYPTTGSLTTGNLAAANWLGGLVPTAGEVTIEFILMNDNGTWGVNYGNQVLTGAWQRLHVWPTRLTSSITPYTKNSFPGTINPGDAGFVPAFNSAAGSPFYGVTCTDGNGDVAIFCITRFDMLPDGSANVVCSVNTPALVGGPFSATWGIQFRAVTGIPS